MDRSRIYVQVQCHQWLIATAASGETPMWDKVCRHETALRGLGAKGKRNRLGFPWHKTTPTEHRKSSGTVPSPQSRWAAVSAPLTP